jgi:hypothetical protein
MIDIARNLVECEKKNFWYLRRSLSTIDVIFLTSQGLQSAEVKHFAVLLENSGSLWRYRVAPKEESTP